MSNFLGEVNPPSMLGSRENQLAATFRALDYEIHADEVRAFHMSEAPIRIVTAPARTSKSFSAAADALASLMPTRPLTTSLTWLVGPDYNTNKEFHYLWSWIVEERQRFGLKVTRAVNNPNGGVMLIVVEWGVDEKGRLCRAIVEGKSTKNETALQGEAVSYAILSEAAEHQSTVFDKYLSTRSRKIVLPTTPKPSGEWIRELSEQGADNPTLGIESFTFPTWANPYYDKDRFQRALEKARANFKNPADDPYFAEQFLGQWVYYTGRALPFGEQNLLIARPPDLFEGVQFVSCDYGYEHPAVALFWGVHPTGLLVVFDEIYQRHLTTQQFCQRVIERTNRLPNVSYVCGDPARPEVARVFRDHGLNVWDVDPAAMRDRAASHRMLVDALSIDATLGHPRMFLTRNCEHTIREWRHLHYREGMANEYGTTALIGRDDAFDAARMGIATRPNIDPTPQPRSWVEEIARRRREQWSESDSFAAQLGMDEWAGTGRNPYDT